MDHNGRTAFQSLFRVRVSISEAVRRVLTPLGVRVTFKPNLSLKQLLVRPKDQVPDREKVNVVYQVPCANCSATYEGQTGRQLKRR